MTSYWIWKTFYFWAEESWGAQVVTTQCPQQQDDFEDIVPQPERLDDFFAATVFFDFLDLTAFFAFITSSWFKNSFCY